MSSGEAQEGEARFVTASSPRLAQTGCVTRCVTFTATKRPTSTIRLTSVDENPFIAGLRRLESTRFASTSRASLDSAR